MFDRYMQDKRRRQPLLWASLGLAAVGEVMAVAAFLIASVMHVDEVEPPPLYALLIRPAFPPPPVTPPTLIKPPPTVRNPPAPRHPRGPTSTQPPLAQPATVPTTIPTAPSDQTPPESAEPTGSGGQGPPGEPPRDNGPPALPPLAPPPVTPRKVPPFLIRKQQLSGADPHLPALVKLQHRGQTLTGVYLLCIDKSGQIFSVKTLSSIPEADDQIITTLKTWTYKEQAIPVCFVQNFEFVVE